MAIDDEELTAWAQRAARGTYSPEAIVEFIELVAGGVQSVCGTRIAELEDADVSNDAVLFLDIDGVLNANTNTIEPHLVTRLNRIVDATGCLVVLSSTWRIGRPLCEVQHALKVAGFTGVLHGKTPNQGCMAHLDGGWRCDQAHRGHEILTYLREAYDNDAPAFVILDDSADMEPFMDKLVRTWGYAGLQDKEADEAIAMLRRPR